MSCFLPFLSFLSTKIKLTSRHIWNFALTASILLIPPLNAAASDKHIFFSKVHFSTQRRRQRPVFTAAGQVELFADVRTSVLVVVGREEGPFSAPKALEAPMGELGPEPGALFVGVESAHNIKESGISVRTRPRRARRGLATKSSCGLVTDHNGLRCVSVQRAG